MTVTEKSAPTITSFGIATTKGKVVGDPKWVEGTITAIVSGWKHLVGANLLQELTEFAAGIARASAHLLVSWIDGDGREKSKDGKDSGGGFATVMDFLFVMDGIRKEHNAALQREGLRKKQPPKPNKTAG
jgi:hypothetical protein